MSLTKSITKYAVAVLGAACLGTAAQAAIVGTSFYIDPTSGHPIPTSNISASQRTNAQTDDAAAGVAGAPAPRYTTAGFTTYDLAILVTDQDWTSTDLSVHLTSGQFYNFTWQNPDPSDPSNVAPDDRIGNSGLFSSAGNRHARVDTFVTAPGFATPTILGGFTSDGNPANDQSSPTAVFSTTDVHISFGDLVASPAGNYVNARFTVSNNAVGTIYGRVGGTGNQFAPARFTYTIPLTPEPVSASLIGLAGGLMAMRRRRA